MSEIRLFVLSLTVFFTLSFTLYFGCTASLQLLGTSQRLILMLLAIILTRCILSPFLLAAKRKKRYPDTDALYYFDGIKQYCRALSLMLLADLIRICSGILLLPGIFVLYYALQATTEDFAAIGMMLWICGSGLLCCGGGMICLCLKSDLTSVM